MTDVGAPLLDAWRHGVDSGDAVTAARGAAPPGIPLLVPGEVITARTVAALRRVADDGARTAYAQNPTLTTFVIVDDGRFVVE